MTSGPEDGGPLEIGLSTAFATVPSRAPVEAFEDAGECLLYNPSRDEASALNRTATEVWHLCDGSLTVLAIAQLLGERYGVDGTLLVGDVAAAIDALRTRGLIAVPEDRAPGTT